MPRRKIIQYNPNLKLPSRKLRKNMTEAEGKLWKHIRKRQIKGVQFLRQRPIGNYIVDFYAPETKLVIEVDGGQHFTEEGKRSDRDRDAYLNDLGLRVLRYNNYEVLTNIEGVVSDLTRSMIVD